MYRPVFLALILAAPLAAQKPADLIVTNARIYTVDDTRPVVAAMAVRDGRIAFTGSVREAMALKGGDTRRRPRRDARSFPEWSTRTRTCSGSDSRFKR